MYPGSQTLAAHPFTEHFNRVQQLPHALKPQTLYGTLFKNSVKHDTKLSADLLHKLVLAARDILFIVIMMPSLKNTASSFQPLLFFHLSVPTSHESPLSHLI